MEIEIINTGSELLAGRVLNTHQQWLCAQLTALGHRVNRQVAVADAAAQIESSVRESLSRSDLVILTGGLGPTSDDLTRDRIAGLLGRELYDDPTVLTHIQGFFNARHRAMPERTKVQAKIPEGARVLPNRHGTAPGLILELDPNPHRAGHKKSWIILLPGPPNELRPMFRDQVIPLLRQDFPADDPIASIILKTTGLGESIVEEKITDLLQPLHRQGLEIGFCARVGEVDVCLVARGPGATTTLQDAEHRVRTALGDHVFGAHEDQLESILIRLLTERGQKLALAESCTGGYIAHRLTNIPGASAVLLGSVVAYSNETKKIFLGINPDTLAAHGAVSALIAVEMAEGVRRQTAADYALSVTGIAGPSGGTADKPVGTVFIALAAANKSQVVHHLNSYDRETFKQVTSQQALELLRRAVISRDAW